MPFFRNYPLNSFPSRPNRQLTWSIRSSRALILDFFFIFGTSWSKLCYKWFWFRFLRVFKVPFFVIVFIYSWIGSLLYVVDSLKLSTFYRACFFSRHAFANASDVDFTQFSKRWCDDDHDHKRWCDEGDLERIKSKPCLKSVWYRLQSIFILFLSNYWLSFSHPVFNQLPILDRLIYLVSVF